HHGIYSSNKSPTLLYRAASLHKKLRIFGKRCGNLNLIKTPLMEYTRFPQAATRPSRAYSSLGVSPRPFLLWESRIFHSLDLNSVHFPYENPNTKNSYRYRIGVFII